MLKNREGMAEVRLTEPGIALYGALHSASSTLLSIELITVPRAPGIVRCGMEAEVHYAHGGSVFASVTSVQGLTDSHLDLTIVHRARPSSRRSIRRAPCDIPVQYRVVRPDGRTGAWMECSAEDISAGGIGLLIPSGVEIPRRIEMRFFLPIVTAVPTEHRRLHSPDSAALTDPHPFKAFGRVVHCRPSTYGRMRAGTAFSGIASSDRDRLARFVESVTLKAP